MKKNIYLAAALILLVSCSSKEKKQEVMEDAPLENATMLPEDISAPSPAPIKPSQPSDLVALQEAIKSNNDDKIREEARKRLAHDPNDQMSLNAMGVIHLKANQPVAAEYFFSKALKSKAGPKADIYSNLGLVDLKVGDKAGAVKKFRQALSIDSGNYSALVNLGSYFLEEKDYVKANVAFESAVGQSPKDSKVWNNYGISCVGTKKYDKAASAYKKAIELMPGQRDYLLNLAIVEIEHLKKYDQGLDTLNKIKFLGPTSEASSIINLLENKAKAGLK